MNTKSVSIGKQTCHREVTTYTVRYHEFTAVMTEPEARDRFPDIFDDLDTGTVPPRPKRHRAQRQGESRPDVQERVRFPPVVRVHRSWSRRHR